MTEREEGMQQVCRNEDDECLYSEEWTESRKNTFSQLVGLAVGPQDRWKGSHSLASPAGCAN